MKYFKRLNVYKASNVSFYPLTREAYSYGWWRFVAIIDGLVVFNEYRYSVSTSKHQQKVSGLLRELGIKIDLYVSCHESLSKSSVQSCLEKCFYKLEHTKLVNLDTVNNRKKHYVTLLEAKIREIREKLGLTISRKVMAELKERANADYIRDLEERFSDNNYAWMEKNSPNIEVEIDGAKFVVSRDDIQNLKDERQLRWVTTYPSFEPINYVTKKKSDELFNVKIVSELEKAV